MRQLRLYWSCLFWNCWAALVVIGCVGLALVPGTAAAEKSAVEAADGVQLLPAMPGHPKAHDFTLPDLDGKPHRLSDYRGRVVVLNFWATWCPPCRHEIPSMQRAFEKLKTDKVVVVAVHVGGGEDKVWDFFTDYEVRFPVLMDKTSKVAKDWPFQGLPTTFVIDPAGRIAYRAIGGRDWDAPTILKILRQLAQGDDRKPGKVGN